MSIIPHKYPNLALGLQSAKGATGTGVTSGIIALPLPEGADLETNKNYSFFQYSGGHYGLKHYESEGQYVEGSLRMPLVPGYTVTDDLYDWIWGTSGTYHQPYWGTLYRDMGNGLTETYVDVRVMSGTIEVDYGAEYAAVDLNVAGIQLPSGSGYAAGASTIFQVYPYRYSEAGVQLGVGGAYGAGGGALSPSNVTTNHSLEFDKMVESPGDMGTLNGTTLPYDLPAAAKPQWTGSFERIFTSTDVYDAFINEEECQYQLTLTRSGVAACTIAMPRVVYTENPLNQPDSGIVREDGISFQALEATDGSTDACAISESVV